MKKYLIFLIFMGAALSACADTEATADVARTGESPQVAIRGSQKYRVTFVNNWNSTDHVSVPDNAHFSPIVAVAHNNSFDLLPVGAVAGPSLEPLAELGRTDAINSEIAQAQTDGRVGETLNTSDLFLNAGNEISFEIAVSEDHAFLSLVTMIAPSPDWVVGVSNLKLYSEESGFYAGVENMPLYALNVGTEDGDVAGNYSINNNATAIPTPISFLSGAGFSAPFAYISITIVE